jgi:phosphate transport system permease protein
MTEATITSQGGIPMTAGEQTEDQSYCVLSPEERANLDRRHMIQRIAFGFLWLTGGVAILALLVVIAYVLASGGREINADFLLTAPQGGLTAEGGISTTIVTTLYVVLLTIGIAAPLGIGAAVFLVEYAGEMQGRTGLLSHLVSVIRFTIEILAGVPSIIFGLFGYALFVSGKALGFGFSLLSGSLACACLLLPVMIRASEEALRAVPVGYRHGSLALGATQWQTVRRVVLPAALPGIITGIVLSVGRVVSETAVFYVTLGSTHHLPETVMDGGRTMAMHLYYLAMDTMAFEKAMGTGAVLVVAIILINLTINLISRRLTAGLRGR